MWSVKTGISNAVFGPQDNLILASYFAIGMLLIWSGVNYLDSMYGMFGIGSDTYNISKTVMTVFVLVLGVNAFRIGEITDGMLATYIGLSSFIYSFGSIVFDVDGSSLVDFLLSFVPLISGLIYIHKRRIAVSIASFLVAISMAYPYVTGDYGMTLFMGVGLLASGLVFLVGGLFGLALGEWRSIYGAESPAAEDRSDHDLPYELMIIPGLFTLGILCAMTAASTYDGSFYVASLLMSITAIAFAIGGLIKGIALEGLLVLMYSFSTMLTALLYLLDYAQGNMFGVLFSVVIFVCGIAFLFRKDYLLSVGSVVFGAISMIGFAAGYSGCLAAGSAVLAIVLIYYSLSRWALYSTGKAILPVLR